MDCGGVPRVGAKDVAGFDLLRNQQAPAIFDKSVTPGHATPRVTVQMVRFYNESQKVSLCGILLENVFLEGKNHRRK